MFVGEGQKLSNQFCPSQDIPKGNILYRLTSIGTVCDKMLYSYALAVGSYIMQDITSWELCSLYT